MSTRRKSAKFSRQPARLGMIVTLLGASIFSAASCRSTQKTTTLVKVADPAQAEVEWYTNAAGVVMIGMTVDKFFEFVGEKFPYPEGFEK